MDKTARFKAACCAVALIFYGCNDTGESPATSPPAAGVMDAVAQAKEAFLACLDEFNVEPEVVEVEEEGLAGIRFPRDTPRKKVDAAMSKCEPVIARVLEAGDEGSDRDGLPTTRSEAASDEEVAAYVDSLEQMDLNGSVLAVRDGQVVAKKGVGRLGPGLGEPRVTSAFDIASVSKTFTAAAICALEEDGMLSRDDTLGDIFRDVPRDKTQITLNHLLSFEGGFHEYLGRGDFEKLSRAGALRRAFAQELRFDPGTDSAYSNTEYTVLAAVVEEVARRPFTEVVRERLLDRAGLSSTGFYGDHLWKRGDAAVGAGIDGSGKESLVDYPSVSWALLGAGGMISTADDLGRWIGALHRGDVLGEKGLACRAEAVPSVAVDGLTIYGYAGGNDLGFNSFVLEAPAERTFLVTLDSSSGPDEAKAEAVGAELGSRLLGVELPGS